ncbi:uncharacterized protein si:dkeyp-97a10.2 isoform X1 [Phycodurus eques]|uniref:uncharacterized protein si:dkeyp-97a10.2 isoform X1 n=1 Tax=Phycodurus eques TaxID=693459 RepID=UPI002ACD68A1|nr:uncharacterized protein si:dkeyp-97a10.2 isoform X1 [Phycodurus eques]XP_061530596.1 uncharacterized protein si:dkeyp-97a10.2 isoform X1 [Phycodurus eques]
MLPEVHDHLYSLERVQLQVVTAAPKLQPLHFLSIRRLVTVFDEADDCGFICKLQGFDRPNAVNPPADGRRDAELEKFVGEEFGLMVSNAELKSTNRILASQRAGVPIGAHLQRGTPVHHPGLHPGPARPHRVRLPGGGVGRHLGAGARERRPRRAGRAGRLSRRKPPAARPVRRRPSQRARQRGAPGQRPARQRVRKSRRGRLRRHRDGEGGTIQHGALHRQKLRGGAPRVGEHQRVAFVAGVRRGLGHGASVQLAARARRRHRQRGPSLHRRRHPGGHQAPCETDSISGSTVAIVCLVVLQILGGGLAFLLWRRYRKRNRGDRLREHMDDNI